MAQPATGGSSVNRDLGAKLNVMPTIAPILGNNTTEGTGVGVDLKGYEGAVVLVHFGISADTLSGSVKALVSIQESSDDGSTDAYAAIPATSLRIQSRVGTGAWTTLTDFADIDDAAEDDVLYKVTILPGSGRERYVRALITFTGTHTNGTPIAAYVLRGFPRVETL